MEDRGLIERRVVEDLLDRWMNDPSFKEQLRSDPKTALRLCGIDATDDMVKAMKTVALDASVETLRDRIVKGQC